MPDQRRYVPGTNVLETTWHTPTGWLTVWDLLVVGPAPSTTSGASATGACPPTRWPQGTLLRIATCFSGRVEVQANCLPQFDYGRTAGEWTYDDGGYERRHLPERRPLARRSTEQRAARHPRRPRVRAHDARAGRDGVARAVVGGRQPRPPKTRRWRSSRPTEKYWRDWLGSPTIADHPWRPYIERSALAFKGLSYAPTGAIMAAGTTSLPETPGGERNWDYRYTWIRDTAFMLRALHGLGFDWEAFEYFAFILETLQRQLADRRRGDLQIMYGIGGETDLTEHTLDHLSGYRNSRPVRIGNGAYDQHQHDVWGMLLDSVAVHQRQRRRRSAPRSGRASPDSSTRPSNGAPEPDQGIWEMRGDPQHFVASKVMCWVAADRGMPPRARRATTTSASSAGRRPPTRSTPRSSTKGVDERGVFVQHYDTKDLDASILLIPIMGFLPARRRAGARHRARDRRRAHPGRPRPALPGRHHRRRPLRRGGHVHHLLVLAGVGARASSARSTAPGRCSRSCSRSPDRCTSTPRRSTCTTGQHLGNFPQAFTHLALIDAAQRLIAIDLEAS